MRVRIEPCNLTTPSGITQKRWAVVVLEGSVHGPYPDDILYTSLDRSDVADWCQANGHTWGYTDSPAMTSLDVIGALTRNIHIHGRSAAVVWVEDLDDYFTINDIQIPEVEDGTGDYIVATINLGRPFDNRRDV